MVEMDVARLRALTQYCVSGISIVLKSRNGCSPLEGIDTFCYQKDDTEFFRRNGCSPFEGADTVTLGASCLAASELFCGNNGHLEQSPVVNI